MKTLKKYRRKLMKLVSLLFLCSKGLKFLGAFLITLEASCLHFSKAKSLNISLKKLAQNFLPFICPTFHPRPPYPGSFLCVWSSLLLRPYSSFPGSPSVLLLLVLLFLPTSAATHGPGTESTIQMCCLSRIKHPDIWIPYNELTFSFSFQELACDSEFLYGTVQLWKLSNYL